MTDTPGSDISDEAIVLPGKRWIPLGLVVTFLIGLPAGTYTVLDKLFLQRQKDELAQQTRELEKAQADGQKFVRDYAELAVAYKLLANSSQMPLLLSPAEEREVIAREIPFRWKFSSEGHDHDPLLLEIYQLEPDVSQASPATSKMHRVIEIPRPEALEYFLPTDTLVSRKIFWRLQPGSIVDGKPTINSPASRFGFFTWDSSVISHIRNTKNLDVGINPQATGPFERKDNGKTVGLDVDLANMIGSSVERRLSMKAGDLKVTLREMPWASLLVSLQDHTVDLVISSMTRTLKREQQNAGIKFSSGYYTTHEILIAPVGNKLKFPQDLIGKSVGTLADTTNQAAAKKLSAKLHFHVIDSYETWDSLYSAMDQDKIGFALVDDVFARETIKGGRYQQFGPPLDKLLSETDFYESEIGFTSEEYGVAVNDALPEAVGVTRLVDMVSEILCSVEGRKNIGVMDVKYGVDPKNAESGSSCKLKR